MSEWWINFFDDLQLEMAPRLLIAALAGAVLGWEREWQDKPAGLRTHMMVALGAAAFMLTGLYFVHDDPENPALRIDPTHVIAGIVGGVGFLGAGTIIEARGNVQGITTAAGIWVAAAVGTACGIGMYGVAFTSVIMAVLIMSLLGWAERWLFPGKARESEAKEKDDDQAATKL